MGERAVVFESCGERLVGVVSEPDAALDVGVVILVGGPQYRAGSHRQFVLLARALSQAGISSLRFDYRGMGDSTGLSLPFADTMPDIASALDAFSRECPAMRRVVLWGLCDGASAAMLYWHTTRDVRVAGWVLANPWVLTTEAFDAVRITHHWRTRWLDPQFWRKLAAGKVDLIGTAKDAFSIMRRRRRPPEVTESDFRAQMEAALREFNGPVLVMLSDRDATAAGFVEYFDVDRSRRHLMTRPNIERQTLVRADHTFSDCTARAQAERITTEWVRRSFAAAELARVK